MKLQRWALTLAVLLLWMVLTGWLCTSASISSASGESGFRENICQASGGHIHEEICYDVSGNLRCSLPQAELSMVGPELHRHSTDCFSDDTEAVHGLSVYTLSGILFWEAGALCLLLEQVRKELTSTAQTAAEHTATPSA